MITKAKNIRQLMLLDSDLASSQRLSMMLRTRGYEVISANRCEDALKKISSHTDLILLKSTLNNEKSLDVCRQLKTNDTSKDIPLVIYGTNGCAEDIIMSLYMGADDYIKAPYDFEELVARLEVVMRRQIFVGGKALGLKEQAEALFEIRHIIDNKLITPYFQPIYRLKPFELLGVEALSRADTQGILANPEVLFKVAMQFGFYQDLEMVSWGKILSTATDLIQRKKLFLNCNPYLVEQPKFLTVREVFQEHGVDISNVFLEITERSAVSDYQVFFKYLQNYRDHGFKFAVDDVGGGYASLESIVRTRPEVIKISGHIIQDLAQNPFKKSIVRFISRFCKENNILSIAEGIETKEDLEAVAELGIDAGQGYYLYRPTPELNIAQMSQIA